MNAEQMRILQCIEQAKEVLKEEKMMDMQSHILSIAMTLYKTNKTSTQKLKAWYIAKKI